MQKRVETKKCDENIHEGGAEKVVKDKSGEEEVVGVVGGSERQEW